MPSPRGTDDLPSHNRSQESARVVASIADRSEDILLRNYDHRSGYDLHLTVVTHPDSTTFQKRYYLPPGAVVSECDLLPSPDCEITVVLDGVQEMSIQCQIDSSPDHTAVIEIGNGNLSLTEGLHA
jgi:hypothetical protein